jgi:sulfate/thiosulfate transport system ATP-binding protein
MSIAARGISKRFASFTALDDVSLEVKDGELIALLGPSGSGKTTLLRILAGLELADRGSVHLDGEDATERSARERRVGFVFQHYALFRHMSVFENIAFGMRVAPRKRRLPSQKIRARVHELLALVQLDGLAGRLPSQLSGGQRQRVALARSLAVEPRVLLLDEPFGALDSRVRRELRRWLRRLHDELGITSVFVTHDQEEALELADRIVVMNQGKIEQVGAPDEVYHQPATPFVLSFLGEVNLFHARTDGSTSSASAVTDPTQARPPHAGPLVYVRPHLMEVLLAPNGGEEVRATVQRIHRAGPIAKLELANDSGAPIHVELTRERLRELGIVSGATVWVAPREKHVFYTEGDGI